MTRSSSSANVPLAALLAKGCLDVVANYLLVSSLIFYVRAVGGTNTHYGWIAGAHPLASCLCWMMPGYERKSLVPGLVLALVGHLCYTGAVLAEENGIYVLVAARLLVGVGGAASSAGNGHLTSIAAVVQNHSNELTMTSVLVTMGVVNTVGAFLAPCVNASLADLDTTWTLPWLEGRIQLPLDAYNGVGLVLAFLELVGFLLVYFLVPELEPSASATKPTATASTTTDEGWKSVLRDTASNFSLLLPLFIGFVAQSAHQFLELAVPPVMGHTLGSTPTDIAAALAVASLLMGFAAVFSHRWTVTDTTLLLAGCCMLVWTYPFNINFRLYVAPIVLGFAALPKIALANQSHYSKATMRTNCPELHHSLYGMTRQIANVATPLVVGTFVLRSPAAVEEDATGHELTRWVWYLPISMGVCLLGVLYVLHADDDDDSNANDKDAPGMEVAVETTGFLPSSAPSTSIAAIQERLTPVSEARRLRNLAIQGGNHTTPLLVPLEPRQQASEEPPTTDMNTDIEKENSTAAAAPPPPSGNQKVLVLISSYSTNHQTKSNQDRALTILRGLQIPDEQLEIVDGANPSNKQKRNELFALSGIRAKYPQFFLVQSTSSGSGDDDETTTFLATYDDFEMMNEMGTLKEALNLS